MNDQILTFPDRAAFRAWLDEFGAIHGGIWLLFGKKNGPKTLSANDALEEALCFGWIDGLMKSIDETCYKKYFSIRKPNSVWSEKNKTLIPKLESSGIMTDDGRAKIAEAKQNGQWDAPKKPGITDEDIDKVAELLKGNEPAYTNFQAMAPSVRKAYTGGYLDAKTDAGREKRLAWMIDRLNQNLKPM